MRRIYLLLLTVCFAIAANSQNVTTNGGSGLAATYPDLASAITALNAATITSPVVITLTGNETAPAGGYAITQLGGTSTNTIIVQGSGSTITAGLQVAGGAIASFDALFKIIGGDWITVQNFTMQENAGNTITTPGATNTMTEFGVLLATASATDGAQNNTIQNNIITLNSTYTNSIGIFSTSASSSVNAAQDATSTAGTNSNNKVYGNTISNVAYGIGFICPPVTATVLETGNDIGGSSGATANTITFGNATASSGPWNRSQSTVQAGIFLRNAAGNSVRFNSITSNSAAYVGSGGLNGVLINSGTAPTGVTYTSTVSDNTIVLTTTGVALVSGIDFGHGIATGTIVGSSNNVTINQIAGAAVSAALIGIKANYTSATNTLNANTVTIVQDQSAGATTSPVTCVTAAAVGTTVNVTNNTPLTIRQNAPTGAGSYGSGAITYINVSAASGTINVTGNSLNTATSTIRSTGTLIGVFQDATVTALVNIKSNTMNVDRVAASGASSFTTTSGTPSEVADTVSNNNITITGLTGTSSVTAIASGGGPSTPGVNNKSICNNSISITGAHTGASIGINSAFTNTGIFRNNSITISCASASVTGFSTSSSAAQISGNSFSLTTSATAPTGVTGILASSTTGGHSITANTFTQLNLSGIITATPTVSGISIAGGTAANVFSNTITNITVGAATSTGNPIVDGILVSGGVSVNVFKNKIYGIVSNCTGATGVVNGIRISGGGTTGNNYYNNLIGVLTAPASTNPDGIRGISITSTTATTTNNVYYNSVYLSGAGGTNFGSSGIFHTASATATTAALNLRNNIIVNNTTPNGTGLAVAFRRSSGAASTLANYASTSNNNLFYAGTPGANNLIYSDGTSTAQTLAAYKGGVFTAGTISPRDGSSVTENPSFLSTSGASSNFLHIDPSVATQIESGAGTGTGVTDDFDGDARNGSTPDIGADEGTFTLADISGPSISYTPVASTCNASAVTLNATITDPSGVPTAGAGLPVLYWRINGGGYTAATATFISGSTYQFTFGSGVVTGDNVFYYIVAQDNAGTPNVSAFPAAGATGFSINPPAASTPPTTPSTYSILTTLGGTFTVGVGGNYTTLTAAVADYNAKCLAGPVVFSLIDATYPGETFPIVINANLAASSVNTLTIKPASGVTASITGSSAVAIIKLNGADYVIIDGSNNGSTSRDLTISNTNAGTSSAVLWLGSASVSNGATNNTIKNCTIIGNGTNTTLGGIVSSSGTTIGGLAEIANSNNTYNNNAVKQAFYGFALVGPTGNESGTVVTNNTIGSTVGTEKIGLRGIGLFQQQNVNVSNNTVAGINSTTTGTGSFAAGIAVLGTVSGGTINANKISDVKKAGAWGAAGIALNSGSTGVGLTISNNFIYDVAGGGYGSGNAIDDNGSGIVVNGGSGFNIYYNTINTATSQATAASFTQAINITSGVTAAGALDIRNNILVNTTTNTTGRYAIYSGATATVYSNIDNNDYYTAGTLGSSVGLGFLGASQTTLTGMQTAFGGNTNSQNAQPTFTSATDLHLVTPDQPNFNFLESKGVAIGGVTTDIDGNTRPNGAAPDIGADEFVGSPPACGNVTNLVASSITSTSANLNWDITPGATGYEYAVTTSATPPGSGTATTNNFVTPVPGLLPSTIYYAHVRSDCGGGNFGNWATISFTTTCASITSFPWTEGFESLSSFGAGVVPLCWSTELISGANFTSANTPVRNSLGARTGTNYIWSRWSSDAWLYAPGFTLTGGVSYDFSFYYRQTDAIAGFTITTAYGSAASAGSMTNTLGVITDPVNTAYAQAKYTFTPSTSGTYYFGVHSSSPTSAPWYMEYDDFTLELTPTCVAPSNLSMIASGATTANLSWTAASPAPSNGYEWKVVLSGAGSGGAAVASGTTAAGVTTVSATGLTNGVSYDLYVRSDCGGTFSTYAGPFTYFLNDDGAGAITLTVGAGCTGAPYTIANATASTSEVYPSCSGTIATPVWFKFVAPASGAVRISTDLGTDNDFEDSKVALFSASDSANYATFSIISCDDDGGSALNLGYRSVVYATGLTPGTTYYIAVDKYSTTTDIGTGAFCVAVEEFGSTMIASAANTCATTIESPAGANPGYTGWIPLVDDADSKLIALIKNTGGGTVQNYNVSMNVNPGAVRLVGGQYYLDRSFHLDSAGTSALNPMQVVLFFTNNELLALQGADPAVTLGNLGVTRQTGITCQGDFVATNGTNSYITQSGSGSIGGASWITFTTTGFSNFYLHTSKAPVTLKVFLQGAFNTGLARHKDVTTTWRDILRNNATSQPYNTPAFGNYNGGETVSPTIFNSTAGTTDIIDWVLLELRSAPPPAAPIATRAAFILEDGSIVDLDGVSSVGFRGIPNGSYYVSVRHRNHLGVRNASVQVLDGALGSNSTPALYDFSTAQTQAFQDGTITTNAAMAQDASTGAYMMWGGNANQDATVRLNTLVLTTGDAVYVLGTTLAGNPATVLSPIYSQSDVNMDGIVRINSFVITTGERPFILGTPLGGNPSAVRREHK